MIGKGGDLIAAQIKELRAKSENDKKESYKMFSEQSPLDRAKAEIKKHLEAVVLYRVSVLTNVSTFGGLSPENLSFAAQNMEEVFFVKGDHIIVQDELGDSFFVLEQGLVTVQRKANIYEPAKELKRLKANSHFGELALVNEEPRSATITVLSDTAKCLKMTKAKFDEIMSVTKMFNMGGTRTIINEGVTDKIPLFKSLSAATRVKFLESMTNMTFKPGSYICRQGTIGNTFYILTEGCCHVTLNTDDWKEKEVNQLTPGDYFGEVALIEVSGKRTANVVAFDEVSCMTLSKADFGYLLKGVRGAMVQTHKIRNITDQQALGKIKTLGVAGETVKKEVSAFKSGNGVNRRISSMDPKGNLNEIKKATMIQRLGLFMSESLHITMYSRMYRDMLIHELKIMEFGDAASKIMREKDCLHTAAEAIRTEVKVILDKESAFRSNMDNLFIGGLMRQKNGVLDRLTKGWPAHQYNDLCKTLKFVKVKSMKRIIEVGSKGTSTFLILRGCVRVFSGLSKEVIKINGSKAKSSLQALQYEEDLLPGEYFGEAVLSGMRTRMITALSITTCDLVAFEDDDFLAAQDTSINMSMEERMAFLTNVPFFKTWESYRLYRIAHALSQVDVSKGSTILNTGEVSKSMYFVLRGRVDIFSTAHSQNALLSIQKYEYFGESGFLNTSIHTKSNVTLVEEFCMKAVTRVDLLVLPEIEFNLIDRETADIIAEASIARNLWRSERNTAVQLEKKVFRDLKRSIARNVLKSDYIVPGEPQSEGLPPLSSGPAVNMRKDSSQRKKTPLSDYSSQPFSTSSSQMGLGEDSSMSLLGEDSSSTILNSLNSQLSVTMEEFTPSLIRKGRNTANKNVNKSRESFNAPLGATLLSLENTVRLRDLEDIPSLLDGAFDPLMVLGTATSNKSRLKIYNSLTYLKMPQASRTREFTSRKSQVLNIGKYRELAKLRKLDYMSLDTSSLDGMPDGSELVRKHSMGLSLKNYDMDDADASTTEDIDSVYTDEYIARTGFENSMLFGSGKIPYVKSYCEILSPIERLPTKLKRGNILKE